MIPLINGLDVMLGRVERKAKIVKMERKPKFYSLKVLGVALLLVGMVIFVLVAVLLHEKEDREEGFDEIRLDWLQRPSGPWT